MPGRSVARPRDVGAVDAAGVPTRAPEPRGAGAGGRFARASRALAASLVGRLEAGAGGRSSPEPAAAGFAAAREALLAAAGGALSLTEAAKALGVTRQNLHKRIHTGSALGMLLEDRIVVPKLQLVGGDGRTAIVPGIERVMRPFLEAKAGAWSALQFLLDPDPNLGRPPIEALRAGEIAGAEHAARAYLGLDDG